MRGVLRYHKTIIMISVIVKGVAGRGRDYEYWRMAAAMRGRTERPKGLPPSTATTAR
jgi:hypothetical protein